MFCEHCGTALPEGARFCGTCGCVVDSADSGPTDKKGSRVGNVIGSAADKLYEATGGVGHMDLRFRDFFVEIPKKHSRKESDELFICGTSSTTPTITEVSAVWPKPWIWSRVLLLFVAVTFGFIVIWEGFGNPYALPSIIFIGSLAVPLSVLVFFFETNAPRNITIIDTVKMFFVGGVLSLLVALPLFDVFPAEAGSFVPSLFVGLVEEMAKIVVIALFMFAHKGKNYILNGLLIGAAVGAGFAAFESAGYAFYCLIDDSYSLSMEVIVGRAVLAIGGHVAWAAAEGAALALCEHEGGFKASQLFNPKFVIVAVLCIALHGIWDTSMGLIDVPIVSLVSVKSVLLIIAIWVVLAVMLKRGLDQVNDLASDPAAAEQDAAKESA